MKKIFLMVAILFATTSTSFSVEPLSNIDPLIIFDSCGGTHELDDEGWTWDEIFDYSEFLDWFYCEGGREVLTRI
ncbi:hypothetical protein [Polaribacter sp.]|uniref:hypothetical protein n=1 Tax=Polaribacter sp. TaxID=1920175 RepID=UPI004047E5C0